jgi:hypothetical protein
MPGAEVACSGIVKDRAQRPTARAAGGMAMNYRNLPRTIIVYEVIAFAAIIAITWIDELFVPERLLAAYASRPELLEAALVTVAIIVIGAVIVRMTQKVLSRLFYLEGFLKVCAWCRKIQQDGRWVTMEDYLSSGFATRTTHGMCPECAAKARGQVSGGDAA